MFACFPKRANNLSAILDVCDPTEIVKVCKQILQRNVINVVHHKPTVVILFKIRKFIITQTYPFNVLFQFEGARNYASYRMLCDPIVEKLKICKQFEGS